MSAHIETKHKVKAIAEPKTFQDLLDRVILTDEEKELMRLIYIEQLTQDIVAYRLNTSKSTIKRKHKKVLDRLRKVL